MVSFHPFIVPKMRSVVLLGLLVVLCGAGCRRAVEPGADARSDVRPDSTVPATAGVPTVDTLTAASVVCARCHALPTPDLLPVDRWPALIERMRLTIEQYALGTPLSPEAVTRITRYYQAGSPVALAERAPSYTASPLRFAPAMLGAPPPDQASGADPPVISNVSVVDLDRDGRADVLVSDARRGVLTWIHSPEPGRWIEEVLAEVSAPARVEAIDANGDGHQDLVVAVLGGVQPTDAPIGQVVLLLNDGQEHFTPSVLLSDVPRVPDVRPVDLDGDGDLDILVALFGLYRTGQVGLLENQGDGSYAFRTVYRRNGISHVPVADLDGDGQPDFVAVISQEHEEIVAFLNRGADGFETRLLYKGPHPMFGLSNIELVDLDGDGDVDIVFTNGDALDSDPHPKPWHGVQWLENTGALTFAYHDLTRFPGAYRAVSGDLDNDGDPDIVVTSMLNRWDDPARQSLIWLEQTAPRQFRPHPLSTSPTYLVTADLGDFNGDDRLDVVAGSMYVLQPYYRVGRVTLWMNAGETP